MMFLEQDLVLNPANLIVVVVVDAPTCMDMYMEREGRLFLMIIRCIICSVFRSVHRGIKITVAQHL